MVLWLEFRRPHLHLMTYVTVSLTTMSVMDSWNRPIYVLWAVEAAAAAGGRVGGRAGGRDWDAVMAEVITVLEWDVAEEVGSEANRQKLCRTLCTLVKNVLRGKAGRRRVRDSNPAFFRAVGR